MGELLGALGLAWPRLLLYPGGAFALAGSWLLARWLSYCCGRPALATRAPAVVDILTIVPPLTALTLLPLAPARSFPYGIDLVVALGLLEWPRLRAPGPAPAPRALVRAYGALILAATGMAQASGGLGLSGLLSWPERWQEQGLLLLSAGLWLGALPWLLEGGAGGLAGDLRGLGLLLVGALPVIGAMAAVGGGLLDDLSGWIIPPAAFIAAALVVGGAMRLRRQAVGAP